jgi:serine phosphatase RsbU (regulator of sigma subunit)
MLKVASSFYFDFADDPAVFLTKINKTMADFTHGQFITACYACIDLDNKTIIQANAGHWPLLVKRKNQKELIFCTENGIPIGWSDNEVFINNTIDLEEGDRIVLYTDGITEARNDEDKMYGQDAFYKLIIENDSYDVDAFSQLVIKEITEWTGVQKKNFDDDVTLIVIDLLEREF